LPAPRVALLQGTARPSPFLCANTASGEFAPETPISINSLYLEVIDPSDLRQLAGASFKTENFLVADN
jgi:hypothetical protein